MPMIRNKDILNSLPLLASILGRNYGVKVVFGGNNAYTDGNTIHLPALPLECETELLGFARGYCDHEAAHIRHTDFEALREAKLDAVTKHFWNSIEDWRVETKLADIFPGCRQHFRWLARKIFVEDKCDEQQDEAGFIPASSILEYVLLAVRAWEVPEIAIPLQRAANHVDSLFPGIRGQIDVVLDRIRHHCPDTPSAIAYARELTEVVTKWQPCENPEQSEGCLGDTTAPPKTRDAETSNPKERQGRDTTKDEPPQTCPEHPSSLAASDNASDTNSEQKQGYVPHNLDNRNTEENNDGTADRRSHLGNTQETPALLTATDKQTLIDELFKTDPDKLPKGLGEILADALHTERATSPMQRLIVAKVGGKNSCTISHEEKEEALRASIALRSRLQGVLQAQTRQHVGIGRKGKLHTANLYRLCIGNPRIFRTTEEKEGLNTAVHILLDVSGSMHEKIVLARQACYAVAKSLNGIRGINPAVTAFPAFAVDDSVCPLMAHGTSIPPYLNIDTGGGTPLAPALWWVMQTMLPLREHRKLILVVTDGQPDLMAPTIRALEAAQKTGFEVYGIGIQDTSITHLLPKTSRCIHSLVELAPAMFTLLQTVLLQGGRP